MTTYDYRFVGDNKVMRKAVRMGTRYTIISRPAYIWFECPHCGKDVEVLFQAVTYNTKSWVDGAFCTCPACGGEVELDEFEYE